MTPSPSLSINRRPRYFVAILFVFLVAGCVRCPQSERAKIELASIPPRAFVPPPPASQPISSEPALVPTEGPGPTVMSRVAGGYMLRNDSVRVVISDRTGDVIFWGPANANANMLFRRGIYAILSDLPETNLQGSIEMRDEQTWQFYGESAEHVIWRKIYCLEKQSLFASYILMNNRSTPLKTAIQLQGDLPHLRIRQHTPEQFTGGSAFGTVSMHAFNEFHPTNEPVPFPTLIQSDHWTVAPKERIAFTTQWVLQPSQ